MISINLDGGERVASVLLTLTRALNNKSGLRGKLSKTAADITNNWYDDKADYFDNPNSPTHGPGRKDTKWAAKLAAGWKPESTEEGFSVVFSPQDKFAAGSFLTHILGRTVTAKNKGALTIPIQPEAHGRSVEYYQSSLGRKLFRPKGKSYLAYVLGKGEGISVAYLLRKSVTIPSLKERTGREPLPSDADYREPLTQVATSYIERLLKQ